MIMQYKLRIINFSSADQVHDVLLYKYLLIWNER